MTLLAFAVAFEAAPIVREFGGRGDVEILITGIGSVAARAAVERAIAARRPDLVISAGLAGALDPGLRAGDVILAENFTTADLRADKLRRATLVTCDEIVATADAKAALRLASGADAVDMESEAVWDVCQHHKIPMLGIRAISDDASTDMPVAPELLSGASESALGALRLVGSLVASPGKIPAFIKLIASSNRARTALAEVVTEQLL